jgi:hypothetical protein
LAQRFHDIKEKFTNLQEEAKRAGLNIDVNKTKEITVNNKIEGRITVYRQEIEQVETSYLGSTVTKKGDVDENVKNRIKEANGALSNYILSGEINIFPRILKSASSILM